MSNIKELYGKLGEELELISIRLDLLDTQVTKLAEHLGLEWKEDKRNKYNVTKGKWIKEEER